MVIGQARPKVVVLKADGTNCEVETAHGFEVAGAEAHVVPMNALRNAPERLRRYDILVAPGGFSYGDDVAAGKIMAVELMTFLQDELTQFSAAGKPVVGICNGFQVLVRTGLLPFGDVGNMEATLAQNASGHFECRWVRMRPEGDSAFVRGLPEVVELPVANGEGRFLAEAETFERIESAGLVALRYVNVNGEPTDEYPANPNGSCHAIAGLTDPSGRILGLMPHPERFLLRLHHPAHKGLPEDLEPHGLTLLRRVVAMA